MRQETNMYLLPASRRCLLAAGETVFREGVHTASSQVGKHDFDDSRSGMTSGPTPLPLPMRPARKALKVSALASFEWAVSLSLLCRNA
jgi:hypothetical protein